MAEFLPNLPQPSSQKHWSRFPQPHPHSHRNLFQTALEAYRSHPLCYLFPAERPNVPALRYQVPLPQIPAAQQQAVREMFPSRQWMPLVQMLSPGKHLLFPQVPHQYA